MSDKQENNSSDLFLKEIDRAIIRIKKKNDKARQLFFL